MLGEDNETMMLSATPTPGRGTPANPSTAGTPFVRFEQEVEWNPAQVFVDLQNATQILNDRGLKLAAKWSAEQLMGLPAIEGPLPPCSIDPLYTQRKPQSPPFLYAKTLMDLSEYAHAAAVLSQSSSSVTKVESMPPPLSDLTPAAFALRAYALYMAGEQRKEEEYQERNHSNSGTDADPPSANGYVKGRLIVAQKLRNSIKIISMTLSLLKYGILQ